MKKNDTCKAVTIQPKVVKISQLWNGGWNGAYECDIEESCTNINTNMMLLDVMKCNNK